MSFVRLKYAPIKSLVGGFTCLILQKPSYNEELLREDIAKAYISVVQGPFPKAEPAPIQWNDNWDYKNDLFQQKNQKAIHQIILIRHGQYHHKPPESHEHKLTELGLEQSSLTGKRLRELLNAGIVYKIHQVYYSTMIRATETWRQIQPVLAASNQLPPEEQIEACSMIREGAVCPPIPPSSLWKPEGEEFFKDQQRVEAAFLKYLHRSTLKDNKNDENYSTLLVCHGNVIRYFVMRALQLPPEAWLRTAVWNASITILEIYPSGRVGLRCFGDVGHIPADKVTYS